MKDVPLDGGYTIIDRDPDTGRLFSADMPRGGTFGAALGLIVHRQGNPIPDNNPQAKAHNPSGGATALNSIRWGIREKAFSIHYYVQGRLVYRALPENVGAYHVLEFRVAQERGRPIYPSTFQAMIPRTLTAAPKGQVAGASKPRGDIGMIGIEAVDRVRADGSIYFDQETRQSLVLLGRDILIRNARTRGTWLANSLSFSITGHQTWDQWTRHDDPGQALYLPDYQADVIDLACGREPWRTVGANYDGSKPVGDRPAGAVDAADLAALREVIQAARLKIARDAASAKAGVDGTLVAASNLEEALRLAGG